MFSHPLHPIAVDVPATVKKGNWAGYSAWICALLYAIPHYWFGLGVSFMFPGDFEAGLMTTPHSLFVNWFMGTVAVVASVFGLSFVYPWGDKVPRWFKLIFAWIGCIILSFWGLTYFWLQFFYATGRVVPSPAFAVSDAHPMAVWGYYWYAVFLWWGISLGFAAFTESKNRAGSPRPKSS